MIIFQDNTKSDTLTHNFLVILYIIYIILNIVPRNLGCTDRAFYAIRRSDPWNKHYK